MKKLQENFGKELAKKAVCSKLKCHKCPVSNDDLVLVEEHIPLQYI